MEHLQEFKELNGGVVSVVNSMIFVTLIDNRKVMIQAQKDVTGIPYISTVVMK